ncbi:MAG: hypothetical protein DRJ10_04045 [Bacteroidetes bacterium]|nr:MAG: hypothetical protein DRJ10_04045 [Bacteroidota bacterium]
MCHIKIKKKAMRKFVLFYLISFSTIICFSQNMELDLSKGKDLSNKKEYNSALYYFNSVIEKDSNYLEAYIERAHAYNMLGDYNKALQDYNYVLTKEPDCSTCYFGIATIYDTWFDDKYRAIENYTKVIDLSIKNKDYDYAGTGYFMRAALKQKLGDKKGYLNDLKKGAELNNDICKTLLEFEKNID